MHGVWMRKIATKELSEEGRMKGYIEDGDGTWRGVREKYRTRTKKQFIGACRHEWWGSVGEVGNRTFFCSGNLYFLFPGFFHVLESFTALFCLFPLFVLGHYAFTGLSNAYILLKWKIRNILLFILLNRMTSIIWAMNPVWRGIWLLQYCIHDIFACLSSCALWVLIVYFCGQRLYYLRAKVSNYSLHNTALCQQKYVFWLIIISLLYGICEIYLNNITPLLLDFKERAGFIHLWPYVELFMVKYRIHRFRSVREKVGILFREIYLCRFFIGILLKFWQYLIDSFSCRNGDTYAGEYFADKMHGFGVYRFANGHRYEGAWHEGRRQGLGMYTFRNGETQSGHWQNGILDIPSTQNIHPVSPVAVNHSKVLNAVQVMNSL